MTDTENVQDLAPQTPSAATVAKTAKARSTIEGLVLTVHGGPAQGVYDARDIDPAITHVSHKITHLVMIGIRHAVTTANNPKATWEAFKAGVPMKAPKVKAPAARKLSPARQAIALVAVDKEVARLGLKPPPGRKKEFLATMPEYLAIVEAEKAKAAALSPAEVAERRKYLAVAVKLAELTAVPEPEPAPAEPAVLADAAE